MWTSREHESVFKGSTIPSKGRRARFAIPVFAFKAGTSKIAVPVVYQEE